MWQDQDTGRVMQTIEDRIWRAYRTRKRKGQFHYDEFGQSPYYRLAQIFRMPVRHIKDILDERRAINRDTYGQPRSGAICYMTPEGEWDDAK
jgi:hypothetical protein